MVPATDDLSIDEVGHCASLGGRCLRLTRIEFDLLRVLRDGNQAVIRRDELVSQVWHRPPFGDDHTLEVHVSRLRAKLLAQGADGQALSAVRGIGYRLIGLGRVTPPAQLSGIIVAGVDRRISVASESLYALDLPGPADLLGADITTVLAVLPGDCRAVLRPLLGPCGHPLGLLVEIALVEAPYPERGQVLAGAGGACRRA